MIKLKSILREAGIISEQDESVEFKFEFTSGQSTLSRAGEVELSQLIARVNNMIKRGSEIKSIKIIGSESKVTNQPPFEEPGSLAEARAKALKKLLEQKFPDINIEMTSVGAQGPEYDKNAGDRADDPKYKPFQYVTAQLKVKPLEERIPYSLIDLVYAIPTAEYTRMEGPEGSNQGTIRVYSTGRVNTAGTMAKSAAEYKMKERFKGGVRDLQSIVSRVATKGTGFEDGDPRRSGPLPMAKTIVNKAKQLLTVLKSLPTGAETWIIQNPQQAAELPGVSKPTSIQTNLYAGEIRGFDNLTKFFTAVKNKV